MIRQWSINLALLLLIATLIGIAFFQPGIESTESRPTLTDLQSQLIKEITIRRPARKVIHLTKSADKWRITEPVKARASDFVVNEILSITQTPSLKQLEYNESTRPEEFGFNNPRAVIKYDNSELTFGDINPLNQLQYILYKRQVHMINGNVFLLLLRQYTDYIDRKLLDNNESPSAIKFADGKKLELVKGSWVIKGQKKSPSADDLARVINEWRYANALRVAPYQKATTLGTIKIFYKNNKTVLELDIVSRKPELILARPDEHLQYHFPAGSSKRLFLPGK